MNYKSISWFPRTWKLFLDHSQPDQALCLKPVSSFRISSASAISFSFVSLNESLCDPSAVSLKSRTWLLRPSPSKANNADLKSQLHWLTSWERNIYLIPFPFQNSWSIFRRLPQRSQGDSLKGTKKKEKAEVDKIGKDATGLRQRSCSGWLWSKKSFFQVRGNQRIDL